MPLPESFAPEDVLAAIEAYQSGAIDHSFDESKKFDLIHQGGRFPPKAIAALAMRHCTSRLPVPDDFSGGADSKCFRILRAAGFRIVPKLDLIPFDVGSSYTRKRIGDYIGTLDETTKGDWATVYHFHTDEVAGISGWWFVFASVGGAARTGHDYPNSWLSDNRLEWSGKSHSTLGQPQIESLLSGDFPVLIFSRNDDRDPFTYHGLAEVEAGSGKNQTPVVVVWNLGSNPKEIFKLEDEDAAPDQDANGYASSGKDERERVLREIRARRGQAGFRKSLLAEHGERCAITGCDILGVIEAAHIRPYRGPNDNHVQNGLLLRSDLHTLFDLNLLGIEPTTRRVCVHENAKRPPYDEIDGRTLAGTLQLSHEALTYRWQEFLASK